MDNTFIEMLKLIGKLPWYYIPIVGILVEIVFNFFRAK
jgi:hypothetical protein